MDRNTTIGIVVIAVIIVAAGYYFMQTPQQPEPEPEPELTVDQILFVAHEVDANTLDP